MSKNLNPRVGSMIVLSLISNVLLVEEAAAEKNPGTFFQRESQGEIWVKLASKQVRFS